MGEHLVALFGRRLKWDGSNLKRAGLPAGDGRGESTARLEILA